jgi:hypothetical protein
MRPIGSIIVLLVVITANLAFAKPKTRCSILAPVSNIEKDYQDQYGTLEEGDHLLVRKVQLSVEGLPGVIASAKLSCGAHSCENAIYQDFGQGCFRRLAIARGSIEILDDVLNGYKKLNITSEGQLSSDRKVQVWYYQPMLGSYVPLPSEAHK